MKMQQTVFLVANDDELQMIMEDIIHSWGFRVKCFKQREQALLEMQSETPHYVIVDSEMPKGMGLQLIEDLHSKHLDVPTLIMQGLDLDERVAKLKADSLIKIIHKPFRLGEVSDFLHLQTSHSPSWN